ncbi:MAG: sigma-54 dependent transcriptional regulator [Lentisphaerota bacterium]
MKTLIITGWGLDYACAAAMALQSYPGSDVIGMSKRRLPEFLSEVSGDKTGTYDQILILGVSLCAEPDRIVSTLRKLKKQKVRIIWISMYPLPDWFPAEVSELIEIKPGKGQNNLAELTADTLAVSPKEIRARSILRIMKTQYSKPLDADLAWIQLFDAASSRYRRFQELSPYTEAIFSLAKGTSLSEKQQGMLEEFKKYGHRELKGKSAAIEYLWGISKKVGAEGRCRVLITGETGTGKETVANLIHGHSPRKVEPFIAFNCADLTPHLLESRLFGHEKGAFTGADKLKHGAFEIANGGTLFLDEVAELPSDAQAGLLRVLQEGRFFRLGGEREIEVDVRVIAATNRNLPNAVKAGDFREDLFYRLNVININIPPLRERPEDIEVIAGDIMARHGVKKLSAKQIEDLKAYQWPGNVREVENILERAVVLGIDDFGKIIAEHRKMLSSTELPQSDLLDDAVKLHVRRIREKNEGNNTRTAKSLGISLNTLKKYLK